MWVTVTATATAHYFNLVLKLEPILIIYSLYINVMDMIKWNANILPKTFHKDPMKTTFTLFPAMNSFIKKMMKVGWKPFRLSGSY